MPTVNNTGVNSSKAAEGSGRPGPSPCGTYRSLISKSEKLPLSPVVTAAVILVGPSEIVSKKHPAPPSPAARPNRRHSQENPAKVTGDLRRGSTLAGSGGLEYPGQEVLREVRISLVDPRCLVDSGVLLQLYTLTLRVWGDDSRSDSVGTSAPHAQRPARGRHPACMVYTGSIWQGACASTHA